MVLREAYLGYLELAAAAALPIALSALFAWLLKRTAFSKFRYWSQQVIIGLAFSMLAILATEFGIHIEGASINVRDAAPLAAGLLFGGPAGIIAGAIGGVERWFAAAWGAGMYTRTACSVATVVAGLFGAALHRTAFRKNRPAWWYMLAIGLGVEALHMLLIIWTHMSDLETAFAVAWTCTVPMLTANGLSLMFSAMAVTYIEHGRLANDAPFRNSLQVKLHQGLFRSIVAAFLATVVFSLAVDVQLAIQQSAKLLKNSLDEVPEQLNVAMQSGLEEYVDWTARNLQSETGEIVIPDDAADGVAIPIYVTDQEGTILQSNLPGMEGLNVNAYGRAGELLSSEEDVYIGPYQPSYFDPTRHYVYAGTELADGSRLIVGYGQSFLHRELQRRASSGVLTRSVGIEGELTLLEPDGSAQDGMEVGDDIQERIVLHNDAPNTLFTAKGPDGQMVFVMYEGVFLPYGDHIAVAMLPVTEAVFVGSLMAFLTILTEILIFLTLFIHLSYLVRREVISQIRAVNSSLEKLTGGDLDEVVRVQSSSEFAELSSGINATIDTLKRYIADAAARLDQELEFARTIQRAALPSVFPAFPNRGECDIYASMEAAKEVGGDFYDFYLLGESTLVMVIADVSGKGIPAAMFMMRAKTMLKNFTETGLDVAEAFEKTNDGLCENNEANMFVTAWMGALDLRTGRMRYVNAGHNPMLIAPADGPFAYVKPKAGFVLAGIEGYPYKAAELTLRPGDVLYVYTDGVTEAQNLSGELFGEDRLLESVNRARSGSVEELCDAVRADATAFAGEAEQFDDMTMLAVRVNYLEGPEKIWIQPDDGSAERIGEFVEKGLGRMKVPEDGIQRAQEQAERFWREVIIPSGGRQAGLDLHRHHSEVMLTFRCEGEPDRGPDGPVHTYEDGWNVWRLHIAI